MQPCYTPPYYHPQPCNCSHNKENSTSSSETEVAFGLFQLEAFGSTAIASLENVQTVTPPLGSLLSLVDIFISESHLGWEHSGPRGEHLQKELDRLIKEMMVILRTFGDEGEDWLTQLEFWTYQPVGTEENPNILMNYLSTGTLTPNIVSTEELQKMLINLKAIALELEVFMSSRNI